VLSENSAPVLVPYSFFLSFLSIFSFLVNRYPTEWHCVSYTYYTLRSVPVRIGHLTDLAKFNYYISLNYQTYMLLVLAPRRAATLGEPENQILTLFSTFTTQRNIFLKFTIFRLIL
jgi:hypothetical protein